MEENMSGENSIKTIAESILVKVYEDAENSDKAILINDDKIAEYGCEDVAKKSMVIKYIEGQKWFDVKKLTDGSAYMTINGEGIKHAESIQNHNNKSKQVFVAMSFNPQLRSMYENVIKVAIGRCGLDPVRIDDTDFNGEIIENVRNQIDQCRFVIADFTDNSPGVYFEAGYALGRNIPVIFCCRESDKGEIHFEINHNKFIFWNEFHEFNAELVKRITNTGLMD